MGRPLLRVLLVPVARPPLLRGGGMSLDVADVAVRVFIDEVEGP